MHKGISLTGVPPLFFGSEYDAKQAEASLASVFDETEIVLWRQGLEIVLSQGRGC